MPTIITASQLRSVIGVSSSLYDDTYLNGIIDTSEQIILPMLVSYKSAIQKTVLNDNVATFTTVGIHEFTEGQSVVIPSGVATLSNATSYVGNQSIISAVYAVAVEVFQARIAAGGQIEGVDFTAAPFRMGRNLFNKCVGLLGPYIDTETMAQ